MSTGGEVVGHEGDQGQQACLDPSSKRLKTVCMCESV